MTQRLTRSLFIGLAALVLSACGNDDNANSNASSSVNSPKALPRVTEQSGMLRITTNPGDAQIFVNGHRRGNTPSQPGQTFALKLGEGTYIIEARKADGVEHEFVGKREDVFVADGTLQTIHLDLQRTQSAEGKRLAEERRIKREAEEAARRAEQARLEQERRAEQARLLRAAGYVDHGDGTVTDTQTGLMWMRCSIGQQWNGTTCTGEVTQHTWAAANAFTNQHRFAGHIDWRLPTVDELDTLVYCSSDQRRPSERPNGKYVAATNGQCEGNYQRPTINQQAFPATPRGWFWSSSPNASSTSGAWLVNFGNGHVYNYGKGYGSRVRLVRAGQ